MTLADDLDLPAFLRREKAPAASPEPLPVEKVTYAMPPAPSRPSAHERDHRARLVARAVKEGADTFAKIDAALPDLFSDDVRLALRRARRLGLIEIDGRRYSRTKKP